MKLSNTIFKAIFFVSFISAILSFVISIAFQYNSFQIDKKYIKDEYIKIHKEKIKREVSKVHLLISNHRSKIEQNLKKELKNNVQRAYNIAYKIYLKNKDLKTTKEIQSIIITTLTNMLDNNPNAILFINNLHGRNIMSNNDSFLNIEKNSFNLKDEYGDFITQEQIGIIKRKKRGFILGHYKRPELNKDIEYENLFYVKKFEPFDWYIGTSHFIEDEIEEEKNTILKQIANLRYGINNYIFVDSLDGYALVYDGKKLKEPKYWAEDSVFKLEKNASKKEDGDYIFYNFKKINSEKEFPKMTFVKLYEPWKLIIGTGVYIDEIDNEIRRKEELLKDTIINQLGILLSIIFVLTLIFYLISKSISKFIDLNITNLVTAFKKSSIQYQEIDTKDLTYEEFVELAKDLNTVLQKSNLTQRKLKNQIKIVNNNVLICSLDTNGNIKDISKAFKTISGYKKSELVDKNYNILKDEDTKDEFFKEIWETLKKEISWCGEIKNRNKQGEVFWTYTVFEPEYKENSVIGFTAIMQDLTDKKRVEKLSIVDELTQLYNRRQYNIKIKEEINRAKRKKTNLTLIMIDIDFFKLYNDTYGHLAGDESLKKVASVLLKYAKRSSDFAFRLGGEEFCLIASSLNEQQSYELANHLRKDIEGLKIEHKNNQASDFLTVSIGLIVKNNFEFSNVNSIYKEADDALYKAKDNGRNRVFPSFKLK